MGELNFKHSNTNYPGKKTVIDTALVARGSSLIKK